MNESEPSWRIAIAADDPLAKSGISALAARMPTVRAVADAAPSDIDAEALGELGVDVVVWDLAAGSDRLRDVALALPVVVLGDPPGAREAAAAGARALLARDVGAAELEAAIAAAARGLFVFDAAMAELVLERHAEPKESIDPPTEALTPRELEVLTLLAEGLSNKLIGARLGISENTVKFHVNALLAKLGADTRTEAVVRGARLGLLIL